MKQATGGINIGRGASEGEGYYINVVFEFHASRAIQLDVLQCRAHHIVGLALGLLSSFDRGGLVQVASVFDIESVECILERKDCALVQLWEAPIANKVSAISTFRERQRETECQGDVLLKLEGVHVESEP